MVLSHLLTLLTLTLSEAHAAPSSWLLDGAQVVVGAPVDVRLYRGAIGEGRPMVAAKIGDRQILIALDLLAEPTRIGEAFVRSLGLTPKDSKGERVVEIPEIRLPGNGEGELVLAQVRARVVPGDDLILGLGALDELAVGLLPSKGKVLFWPESQGSMLLADIATSVPFQRQSGRWDESGTSYASNGLMASMEGKLRGDGGTRDIRLHLRTDEPLSVVEPNLGTAVDLLDGVARASLDASIGRAQLPPSLARVEPAVPDPDPAVQVALGYDVLSAADIAMSGSLIAVRPAVRPNWEDTAAFAAAQAKARYAAWAQRQPPERLAPPPLAVPPRTNPEGDPGRPDEMTFHQDLADALWAAGEDVEALARQHDATVAAGDRCLPYLRLGERRLRAAGPRLEDEAYRTSVREPLERAGALWDAWAGLTETERADAAAGKGPPGTLRIPQDDECRRAWGLLMGAWLAIDSLDKVSGLYASHKDTDTSVGHLMGIALLDADPNYAESLLRSARSGLRTDAPSSERIDLEMAIAVAQVAGGQPEAARAFLATVAQERVTHPLTIALIAAELGAPPPSDLIPLPGVMAAHVVHAARGGTPPVGLDEALTGAALREPWNTTIDAIRAVWEVSRGRDPSWRPRRPDLADVWSARAMIAALSGDRSGREDALAELRGRYPDLPLGFLGVEHIPTRR